MSFELGDFSKNLGMAILEDCTCSFFKGVVEKLQEKNIQQSLKIQALEGSKSESTRAKFDLLTKEYCKEIQKAHADYSEEELRDRFNTLYKEYLHYGEHRLEEEDQEELYKRYKIFAAGYIKKLSDTITFGESRILEKQDHTLKELRDISSKVLTARDFQLISEKQSELLNKLCEDIEVPFIEISNNYANISHFHSKYAFLGNVFHFDKSCERDFTYIFTFLIRNIGKAVINEIQIQNLKIYFCKELYDDDPESAYTILKAMQHDQVERRTINLLPNSEQKIHLITLRREEELSCKYDYEAFVEGDEFQSEYENDRLYVQFDMNIIGKTKAQSYHYYIFLSKSNMKNSDDITGIFSVDYVGMKIIKGH